MADVAPDPVQHHQERAARAPAVRHPLDLRLEEVRQPFGLVDDGHPRRPASSTRAVPGAVSPPGVRARASSASSSAVSVAPRSPATPALADSASASSSSGSVAARAPDAAPAAPGRLTSSASRAVQLPAGATGVAPPGRAAANSGCQARARPASVDADQAGRGPRARPAPARPGPPGRCSLSLAVDAPPPAAPCAGPRAGPGPGGPARRPSPSGIPSGFPISRDAALQQGAPHLEHEERVAAATARGPAAAPVGSTSASRSWLSSRAVSSTAERSRLDLPQVAARQGRLERRARRNRRDGSARTAPVPGPGAGGERQRLQRTRRRPTARRRRTTTTRRSAARYDQHVVDADRRRAARSTGPVTASRSSTVCQASRTGPAQLRRRRGPRRGTGRAAPRTSGAPRPRPASPRGPAAPRSSRELGGVLPRVPTCRRPAHR